MKLDLNSVRSVKGEAQEYLAQTVIIYRRSGQTNVGAGDAFMISPLPAPHDGS